MKKRGNVRKYTRRDQIAGHIFISPFILGFLIFTIVPILSSLYYSFTDYSILKAPKYIGLDNYVYMLTKDPQFYVSLKATLMYAMVSVPLKLMFALMVAMLLKTTNKLTVLYRALYYLPSLVGSTVAIAVVWRTMFISEGLLNSIINRIFGTNIDISWIGNPNTAIWTLILLTVWQYGSSMLIFLSGLKAVPTTLYEAADIDGASPVQQFFRITLPMLTPVLFFNLIMQLINGFMSFTQSYVVTQGEPMNLTMFSAVYIYKTSFSFRRMGYGSAMAWFMLIAVSLITSLLFMSSKYWVFHETDMRSKNGK